jgi:hypothetical protein
MTVLLALVVLSQSADSVAVVGFVGAWAIIMGVYLAIAGLSARWAQKTPHERDNSNESAQ